jgi:hypothetical protein
MTLLYISQVWHGRVLPASTETANNDQIGRWPAPQLPDRAYCLIYHLPDATVGRTAGKFPSKLLSSEAERMVRFVYKFHF